MRTNKEPQHDVQTERSGKRLKDVKAVANELTVRLSGSAERIDADITRAVANALECDVAVSEGGITVAASEGRVTLEGEKGLETWRRKSRLGLRYPAKPSQPRLGLLDKEIVR
jgi:hypothetical protein